MKFLLLSLILYFTSFPTFAGFETCSRYNNTAKCAMKFGPFDKCSIYNDTAKCALRHGPFDRCSIYNDTARCALKHGTFETCSIYNDTAKCASQRPTNWNTTKRNTTKRKITKRNSRNNRTQPSTKRRRRKASALVMAKSITSEMNLRQRKVFQKCIGASPDGNIGRQTAKAFKRSQPGDIAYCWNLADHS